MSKPHRVSLIRSSDGAETPPSLPSSYCRPSQFCIYAQVNRYRAFSRSWSVPAWRGSVGARLVWFLTRIGDLWEQRDVFSLRCFGRRAGKKVKHAHPQIDREHAFVGWHQTGQISYSGSILSTTLESTQSVRAADIENQGNATCHTRQTHASRFLGARIGGKRIWQQSHSLQHSLQAQTCFMHRPIHPRYRLVPFRVIGMYMCISRHRHELWAHGHCCFSWLGKRETPAAPSECFWQKQSKQQSQSRLSLF